MCVVCVVCVLYVCVYVCNMYVECEFVCGMCCVCGMYVGCVFECGMCVVRVVCGLYMWYVCCMCCVYVCCMCVENEFVCGMSCVCVCVIYRVVCPCVQCVCLSKISVLCASVCMCGV